MRMPGMTRPQPVSIRRPPDIFHLRTEARASEKQVRLEKDTKNMGLLTIMGHPVKYLRQG